MASNHGFFKYEGNNFSLIPNSEGQAWNISKINKSISSVIMKELVYAMSFQN
jgi:hypothetical protein